MTNEDDKAIWAQYAKGVKKRGAKEAPAVANKGCVAPETPPLRESASTYPEKALPVPPRAEQPTETATEAMQRMQAVELDRKAERNLRAGEVIIEARLDLHGMTEQDAFEALQQFILTEAGRGKRLVLVITGKGRNGESVLHANLPRWCSVPPLAQAIMTLRPAAPSHGGDGAYYLLLRRKTPKKREK